MSVEYPYNTKILQICFQMSNQLIKYHQEAKKHIFGLNIGNISIEGFALTINSRKGIFISNLQPQVIRFFHNSPIDFFQLFF
jgi:hypothetical protein